MLIKITFINSLFDFAILSLSWGLSMAAAYNRDLRSAAILSLLSILWMSTVFARVGRVEEKLYHKE